MGDQQEDSRGQGGGTNHGGHATGRQARGEAHGAQLCAGCGGVDLTGPKRSERDSRVTLAAVAAAFVWVQMYDDTDPTRSAFTDIDPFFDPTDRRRGGGDPFRDRDQFWRR